MTNDRNVILKDFIDYLKTKFPDLDIYVSEPKKKVDEVKFPLMIIKFTRDNYKKRFLGATISPGKSGEWIPMNFNVIILTKDAVFYNDDYDSANPLDPAISGESLLRYLEYALDKCLEDINNNMGTVFTSHPGVLTMNVGVWFNIPFLEPPGIYSAGKDISIVYEQER